MAAKIINSRCLSKTTEQDFLGLNLFLKVVEYVKMLLFCLQIVSC